jgi:hypothetical protein
MLAVVVVVLTIIVLLSGLLLVDQVVQAVVAQAGHQAITAHLEPLTQVVEAAVQVLMKHHHKQTKRAVQAALASSS